MDNTVIEKLTKTKSVKKTQKITFFGVSQKVSFTEQYGSGINERPKYALSNAGSLFAIGLVFAENDVINMTVYKNLL